MPKTKTKMISVRVSEDDYLALKDKFTLHGTRSISALAREALHDVIRRPDIQPVDLGAEVSVLQDKLSALQHEVSRLANLVTDNKAID